MPWGPIPAALPCPWRPVLDYTAPPKGSPGTVVAHKRCLVNAALGTLRRGGDGDTGGHGSTRVTASSTRLHQVHNQEWTLCPSRRNHCAFTPEFPKLSDKKMDVKYLFSKVRTMDKNEHHPM